MVLPTRFVHDSSSSRSAGGAHHWLVRTFCTSVCTLTWQCDILALFFLFGGFPFFLCLDLSIVLSSVCRHGSSFFIFGSRPDSPAETLASGSGSGSPWLSSQLPLISPLLLQPQSPRGNAIRRHPTWPRGPFCLLFFFFLSFLFFGLIRLGSCYIDLHPLAINCFQSPRSTLQDDASTGTV